MLASVESIIFSSKDPLEWETYSCQCISSNKDVRFEVNCMYFACVGYPVTELPKLDLTSLPSSPNSVDLNGAHNHW